jgi:hypothetical protein
MILEAATKAGNKNFTDNEVILKLLTEPEKLTDKEIIDHKLENIDQGKAIRFLEVACLDPTGKTL